MTDSFTNNPSVFLIGGGSLLFLGLIPGLPKVPFFFSAGLAFFVAYAIKEGLISHEEEDDENKELTEEEERQQEIDALKEPAEDFQVVPAPDPLELEVGFELIPLVNPEDGGDLLQSITNIRRNLATMLGLVVPPVRIRDNIELDKNTYVIKINGDEIDSFKVYVDKLLAIRSSENDYKIEGIDTFDPAFNVPAVWITQDQKDDAEFKGGYSVVDPVTLIVTHITDKNPLNIQGVFH